MPSKYVGPVIAALVVIIGLIWYFCVAKKEKKEE